MGRVGEEEEEGLDESHVSVGDIGREGGLSVSVGEVAARSGRADKDGEEG
jgi:hypothetical protein